MNQKHKTKNYSFEQQNAFLKQELTLKQTTMDKLLEISSSQCKILITLKKSKKIIEIAKKKKKNTGRELKNSNVPSTNWSLIKLHCKPHCGVAANDADSVEKIRISKTHKINANSEKQMSTYNPKKEATFSS